ncbi:aspartate 1-decarboxylase [Kocuria rhizophila]|nr:aspartate 1-decarboxylase [Kocuria rhizophila]
MAIVDITNGARLETYTIAAARQWGAGHQRRRRPPVHPGDLVILIAYGLMDTAEAQAYEPPRGARGRAQTGSWPWARHPADAVVGEHRCADPTAWHD